MNGPDPVAMNQVLAAVQTQVVVALWLSAGMILAIAMVISIAAACRRSALACGFAYALTLCFIPVGHARLLGPIGVAAALVGLVWPQQREAKTAAPKRSEGGPQRRPTASQPP
jgi:hypothetical protein